MRIAVRVCLFFFAFCVVSVSHAALVGVGEPLPTAAPFGNVSTRHVPISSVTVSQWTAEVLFERFFRQILEDEISKASSAARDEWLSKFDVLVTESCRRRTWASAYQCSGSASPPTQKYEAFSTPRLVVLPGNRLAVYAHLGGEEIGVVQGWFVEAACWDEDCVCDGGHKFRVCDDQSPITFYYDAELTFIIDISPDALAGTLDIPLIEASSLTTGAINMGCYSLQAGSWLPDFAHSFNRTLIELTQTQYLAFVPTLKSHLEAALIAFRDQHLRPALQLYVPMTFEGARGLTVNYRFDASDTVSAASDINRTVDVHALVVYNVSAEFISTDVNGEQHLFEVDPDFRNNDALWYDAGSANNSVATRLSTSSLLLQAMAWNAEVQGALTQNVTTRILDAHILTDIVLDVPVTSVLREMRVIDAVSPRSTDMDKRLALTRPELFFAMKGGTVLMRCKNDTITIIEAGMTNLTAEVDLVIQMDDNDNVATATVPARLISLFFNVRNYNGFDEVTFNIYKPTGGLPRETLASMLEKALNLTRPHLNRAYRERAFTWPPVVSILLHPTGDGSSKYPPTNFDMTRVTLQNDTTAADEAPGFLNQGCMSMSTNVPNSTPPVPPLPPSYTTCDVIVTTSEHSGTPPFQGTSFHAVQQYKLILTPECRPMIDLPAGNTTIQYYWKMLAFREDVLVYDYTGATSQMLLPTEVTLYCVDPLCGTCQESYNFTTFDQPLSFAGPTDADPITVTLTFPPPGYVDGIDSLVCLPSTMAVLPPAPNAPAPSLYDASGSMIIVPAESCTTGRNWTVDYTGADQLEFKWFTTSTKITCVPLAADGAIFAAYTQTGELLLPCSGRQCPTSFTHVTEQCDTKRQSVPTIEKDVCLHPQGSEPLWLGYAFHVPACPTVSMASPPSTPFNVIKILPLIVCAVLIAIIAVAFVLARRRGMRLRELAKMAAQRINESGFGGSEMETVPVAQLTVPREGIALFLFVVWAVCCAIVWGRPPFERISPQHASRLGLPREIDISNLRDELDVWVTVLRWIFTSGMIVMGLACVRYAWRWLNLLVVPKLPEGDAEPEEGTRLVEAADQHSGWWLRGRSIIVCAVAGTLVILFGVGLTAPPIAFNAATAASFKYNASANSLLSSNTLSTYGSDVSSAAASMYILPEVLMLSSAFVSVLPVGIALGVALRGALAIRQCVKLLAAVPPAWGMIMVVSSASVTCMGLLTTYIIFQPTREAGVLALCTMRCIVGALIVLPVTKVILPACIVEHREQVQRGCLQVLALASVDALLTIIVDGITDFASFGPLFVFHFGGIATVAAMVAQIECEWKATEEMEEAACALCLSLYAKFTRALEELGPKPWWRLSMLVGAGIMVSLTLNYQVDQAFHSTLRADLIDYMRQSGIQFPANVSRIHLAIDPGIEAFIATTRSAMVPMALGTVLIWLSVVATIVADVTVIARRLALSEQVRRLLQVSAQCASVISYVLLILTALVYTIPNYVDESHLNHVCPDCAPEFFRDGEFALRTLAGTFFSAVVFGRIVPMLITFPPAVVRVQVLIGHDFGVQDHFAPLFMATVMTLLCIQFPLLSLVQVAHANSTIGLSCGLMSGLLLLSLLFHPRIRQHATWLHVPILWLIFYILMWVLLIWQAIEADEKLWRVAKKLFTNSATWYEMFGNIFLATAAFCDLVQLCCTVRLPVTTAVVVTTPVISNSSDEDEFTVEAARAVRTDVVDYHATVHVVAHETLDAVDAPVAVAVEVAPIAASERVSEVLSAVRERHPDLRVFAARELVLRRRIGDGGSSVTLAVYYSRLLKKEVLVSSVSQSEPRQPPFALALVEEHCRLAAVAGDRFLPLLGVVSDEAVADDDIRTLRLVFPNPDSTLAQIQCAFEGLDFAETLAERKDAARGYCAAVESALNHIDTERGLFVPMVACENAVVVHDGASKLMLLSLDRQCCNTHEFARITSLILVASEDLSWAASTRDVLAALQGRETAIGSALVRSLRSTLEAPSCRLTADDVRNVAAML